MLRFLTNNLSVIEAFGDSSIKNDFCYVRFQGLKGDLGPQGPPGPKGEKVLYLPPSVPTLF